jgi:translocation protein SEC63
VSCRTQGRWWFGSRSRTKDGVQAATASQFFKEVTEEVTPQNLLQSLSKGFETERGELLKAWTTDEFKSVEKQVLEAWSAHGVNADELYRSPDKTPLSDKAIEAYILLSAHLFRISVSGSLQKGVYGWFLVRTPLIFLIFLPLVQNHLLLHIPVLLNSLLAMSLCHNWLTPTLDVMHLNASFSQALRPGASPLLQFPGVTEEDVKESKGKGIAELIARLEARHDQRATSIRKAAERWGKLDIVDAKLKGTLSVFVAVARPVTLLYLSFLRACSYW